MRVTEFYSYPVKGCRANGHDEVEVEPWGLRHDRRWLITDLGGVAITQRDVATLCLLRAVPGPEGLALSYPDMEPLTVPPRLANPEATGDVWGATVAATPAGREADAWLSAALGREVRLVWLDDPTRRRPKKEHLSEPGDRVSFADEFPLLLANSASLDRLNDWIAESGSDEGPLPMNRFRPNVVVDGAAAFQEDEWVGKSLQIGQLRFRVTQRVGRCIVTTTDQETGERGHEPLRTLSRYRNVEQKLLFGVHLTPVTTGTLRIGDLLTT